MSENNENKSFLDKFNAPMSVLWDNHKTFLIIFGLLIILFKFKDVVFDLLVNNSRKIVQDTKEQDKSLKADQDQANNKANELIKEAESLNVNKKEIDENWHLK